MTAIANARMVKARHAQPAALSPWRRASGAKEDSALEDEAIEVELKVSNEVGGIFRVYLRASAVETAEQTAKPRAVAYYGVDLASPCMSKEAKKRFTHTCGNHEERPSKSLFILANAILYMKVGCREAKGR